MRGVLTVELSRPEGAGTGFEPVLPLWLQNIMTRCSQCGKELTVAEWAAMRKVCVKCTEGDRDEPARHREVLSSLPLVLIVR